MLLITGSTGLLGGHVLYALLQKYDRVAALKRQHTKTDTLREIFSFYTPEPDQLLQRIDWRIGDMLDKESLVHAMNDVSCIVNCAAMVSFNPRDREILIANNVQGTRNLAEAVLRQEDEKTARREDVKTVRREDVKTVRQEDVKTVRQEDRRQKIALIHISSTSALGDGPGDDPEFLIDEDTPRNPKLRHTGYSISKYESEKVLHETGVDVIMLNPGIILGPGQWSKGSSQLFVKAWQGLRYYPFGGTGYIDVRDVADIITQISCQIPGIGNGVSGIGNGVSGIGYQVSGTGNEVSGIGYQVSGTENSDTASPSLPLLKSSGLNVLESSGLNILESSRLNVLESSSSVLSTFIHQRFCLVGANLRYRDFFNRVTDEYGKPNPRIFADKFLTGLAWRADYIRALITGSYPLLTRETAEAAQNISYYSSDKIRKTLNYQFRPIDETIEWVAGCYRKGRQEDRRQEDKKTKRL